MATKAQYFKIGVFVIVGTALAAAGVVAFGLRSTGEKPILVETYFQESVQGLSVGSPVKQRGVQIGSVAEITFVDFKYDFSPEGRAKVKGRPVLVVMAIDPAYAREGRTETRAQLFARTIARGLRVRIASQGITGLSYLDVDTLDPKANPPMEIFWKPTEHYVPSAASTGERVVRSIEEILGSLGDVDFAAIGKNLETLLASVDKALSDAEVRKRSDDARVLLEEAAAAVKRFREILDKPEIDAALTDGRASVAGARKAAESLAPLMEELAATLKKSAAEIDGLVAEARATVASPSFRRAVDEAPGAIAQLRRTLARAERVIAASQESIVVLLRDLRRVALSVDKITTNAEEYPSQMLFGAPPPERKPEGGRP